MRYRLDAKLHPMKRLAFSFLLLVCVSACADTDRLAEAPYIHVLGVAQDAGYPQAGCYDGHCAAGWQDASRRRGAVALGLIDPQTRQKFLFEATPNLPAQLRDLHVEAPDESFQFGGIFLTHAHIGHYTGLMFLGREAMGANQVPVFAMPRMREFLETNGPWDQLVTLKNITLMPLANKVAVPAGRVRVTPFVVPHRDEYSETVGYRLDGPNKSAVFIPDIDKWSSWERDLVALVKGVDYALLDAAFYADGELPGRDMSKIPHPFVSETMAALESLTSEERARVWFIHMNHTNPLLDATSDEFHRVREQGFNIAVEGVSLGL